MWAIELDTAGYGWSDTEVEQYLLCVAGSVKTPRIPVWRTLYEYEHNAALGVPSKQLRVLLFSTEKEASEYLAAHGSVLEPPMGARVCRLGCATVNKWVVAILTVGGVL